MTINQYDINSLAVYREKAAELAPVRERVQKLLDGVQECNLSEIEEAMHELSLRTQELEELRRGLGSSAVLLATYGVDVIDDHTVSFVIPQGISRIAILEEVQGLSENRTLIPAATSEFFRRVPLFSQAAEFSERICIDGNVGGAEHRTLQVQQEILASRKLTMAKIEDLAVAFGLFYVATGNSLFGAWSMMGTSVPYHVRAATTELVSNVELFYSAGQLCLGSSPEWSHCSLAISARRPVSQDSAMTLGSSLS